MYKCIKYDNYKKKNYETNLNWNSLHKYFKIYYVSLKYRTWLFQKIIWNFTNATLDTFVTKRLKKRKAKCWRKTNLFYIPSTNCNEKSEFLKTDFLNICSKKIISSSYIWKNSLWCVEQKKAKNNSPKIKIFFIRLNVCYTVFFICI